MFKFINVQSIHLRIIHRKLLKHQRNQWISFVLFVAIRRLDLIMMLFHALHAKLFSVEMLIRIRLVFFSFSFCFVLWLFFQDRIRCITGQGQCPVAHEIRRKCPKCRLERCFSAGMRKNLILSEEQKQERKKRLEENRNITSQRLSTSELTNSLSITHSASKFEPLSLTSDEIDRVSFSLS